MLSYNARGVFAHVFLMSPQFGRKILVLSHILQLGGFRKIWKGRTTIFLIDEHEGRALTLVHPSPTNQLIQRHPWVRTAVELRIALLIFTYHWLPAVWNRDDTPSTLLLIVPKSDEPVDWQGIPYLYSHGFMHPKWCSPDFGHIKSRSSEENSNTKSLVVAGVVVIVVIVVVVVVVVVGVVVVEVEEVGRSFAKNSAW